MPEYVFRCKDHPRHRAFPVARPMSRASETGPPCPECGGPVIRRYQVSKMIVRPDGWNLRPGEYRANGMGYDLFDYEMERGQLSDDATSVHGERLGAYNDRVSAEWEDAHLRLPDNFLGDDAEYELHQFARARGLEE